MKLTNKPKKEGGFTIIEVVLVLAIAGLIFLIVFLALPALQRSQRDTQRKNDVSRMMSQLTQYQSNRQGAVPTSAAELSAFVSAYLTNNNQTFNDPQSGSQYGVNYNPTNTAPAVGQMNYYTNRTCQDGAPVTGTGARQVAVLVGLEQGGSLCQNN